LWSFSSSSSFRLREWERERASTDIVANVAVVAIARERGLKRAGGTDSPPPPRESVIAVVVVYIGLLVEFLLEFLLPWTDGQ
jgi:hypothetical protein